MQLKGVAGAHIGCMWSGLELSCLGTIGFSSRGLTLDFIPLRDLKAQTSCTVSDGSVDTCEVASNYLTYKYDQNKSIQRRHGLLLSI